MKIAHVSDLHVLALHGIPLRRLLSGKRLQGYLNLTFKRRLQHDVRIARRVLEQVRAERPDHVVVTGDVSNLSLEEEFVAAKELIASTLQMADDAITIVPGNHDTYTQAAYRCGAFERVFEPWMRSDPDSGRDHASVRYPIVRMRNSVAIVGLTSAVPRGAFIASGEIGADQRDRLHQTLAALGPGSCPLLVLVHHPVAGMRGPVHVWMRGLRDADALVRSLRDRANTLIVHGHLHRPVFHRVRSGSAELLIAGVTSASLSGARAGHRAGYQVLEWDSGRWKLTLRFLDRGRDAFDSREVVW